MQNIKKSVRVIILNGKKYSYNLEIKKVKNINLRIKSDKTINVSANSRVPKKIIDEFLISKSDYILNALRRYENLAQSNMPLLYETGDTVTVFGEDKMLTVAEDVRNYIRLSGEYIHLFVKACDDIELKRTVLNEYLNAECKAAVLKLCEEVYPKFEKYDIAFPKIKFRQMVSMWGNCRPERGILTFNTALAAVPPECIKYVVIHEFTHFLVPNHSSEFYRRLSEFMPNWKRCRDWLGKVSIRKLNHSGYPKI